MADGTDIVESRVPPHDLDAEAAVLSACMNDQSKIDQVADVLRPEVFYSEAHRRIFEAILGVNAAGSNPDIVTVGSWLRDHERLGQVGGMAYLTTVLNSAPALANTRAYADTVYGHWRMRQLLVLVQRVASQGYCGLGEFGGSAAYIETVAEQVFQLAIVDDSVAVGSLQDTLRDVFRGIEEINKRGVHVSGTPTGFDRYDRVTSGLHDGELTIVAARPGMGKTSLVTNVATNVAGKPVHGTDLTAGAMIFSLEMPREQLVLRMLSTEAKVESTKIRDNYLTNSDMAALMKAVVALSNRCIRIDDSTGLTIAQLKAKARRTIAEELRKKIKISLIAVDYLQLMSDPLHENSREQEIAAISRGLKGLAKELKIPIIALSQLNRAVETRGGEKKKRPQLSDLRESGAIEQDADNVVFIYRDDYYNGESSEERNIAEIIIAKQRNGPTDTIKLRWDGSYTRFDNLAEGEFEEYER